ncbi:MAG: thiamine pyrophosphate-dependent enzyme [Bacteroidota bacterium]
MKATVADAIGHALKDLGVDIVTHVPGYGASETFQSYNTINFKRSPISFHEEVAYTIAHGASIVGKRAACLIKAQGFAKAANSVIDSLYTSITAGFVTIIFDDKKGTHSDSVLEIEKLLKGMAFPYKKAETEIIYDDLINTFHESEKTNFPHVLIVDADEIKNTIDFDKMNFHKNFVYNRDILKHVVHPLFAEYQYSVYNKRKYKEDYSSIPFPPIPNVPDELPLNTKNSALKYQPFFEVFRNITADIVTGDTTSSSAYALPPYEVIDIITYIGGSIPLAIGAFLAGNSNVWALIGDFGFIAAGHLGLLEATLRELPIKIVILNNKVAASTGNQQIPRAALLRTLAGYDKYTKSISDGMDIFEITEVLEEVDKADELRIVVVDY